MYVTLQPRTISIDQVRCPLKQVRTTQGHLQADIDQRKRRQNMDLLEAQYLLELVCVNRILVDTVFALCLHDVCKTYQALSLHKTASSHRTLLYSSTEHKPEDKQIGDVQRSRDDVMERPVGWTFRELRRSQRRNKRTKTCRVLTMRFTTERHEIRLDAP